MRKLGIIILLLLPVGARAAADSAHTGWGSDRVEVYNGRKLLATGMVGGLLIGSLVDSYYSWWEGATKPFTFHNGDWFVGSNIGVDKTGHLFTSYFYFHTFRNIMLWGGFEESPALFWAAGATAFFALSVEIGDGVTSEGFDYQDLVFNIGGLGYAILQTKVPFLKNFSFKWSYVPDNGYRFPPRFTDYYDAHTYWLSVNVHELLPSSLQKYWPSFLQLAFGYGVDERVSRREGVIGLDFNLEAFPVENEELRLVQKTVNMFHIPAPAVKFTEKKRPRYYPFQTN